MNQLSKALFNLSVNERPNLNLALYDIWPKNAFSETLLDILVFDYFHSRDNNVGPDIADHTCQPSEYIESFILSRNSCFFS